MQTQLRQLTYFVETITVSKKYLDIFVGNKTIHSSNLEPQAPLDNK